MARRDATQEVGLTLEEKAAKALAHVERAAAALRGPPAIFLARSELAKALDVLLQAEDDPYASTQLRPGLNRLHSSGQIGAMGQEEWEAYQKQLKADADA